MLFTYKLVLWPRVLSPNLLFLRIEAFWVVKYTMCRLVNPEVFTGCRILRICLRTAFWDKLTTPTKQSSLFLDGETHKLKYSLMGWNLETIMQGNLMRSFMSRHFLLLIDFLTKSLNCSKYQSSLLDDYVQISSLRVVQALRKLYSKW